MKKLLLFTLIAACATSLFSEEIITPGTVRGTAQRKGIPIYVSDFRGGAVSIADVVRKDLNIHGGFTVPRISQSDATTLNNADYSGNAIHFENWRNLGCALIGKGEVSGSSLTFKLYNTSNGSAVMNRTYNMGSVSPRRVAHAIANDIVQYVLKEKGFFQSRLLFASGRGRAKNIVMTDILGGDRKNLTSGADLNTFPDWFPDHKNILFTSYRDNRAVIYKLDLTTGRTQKLLAMPGMNTSGAISPDGRQLAAILDKDGFPELYTYALSGGSHKRLSRGRENESSPAWSPDSSQIVFSCDEGKTPQIYIMSASGGGKKRICRNVSRYCTSPAWSPDGKKIAFVAQIGANYEICVCNLSSGNSVNVTNNPSNDEFPCWAADSRHIVFSRGGSNIMIVDSETGKESTLTSGGSDTAPALEP
ncbi:PD40 domain-containing protein [bacterium]|nr:PD40 domain-containing protein [bacterium]